MREVVDKCRSCRNWTRPGPKSIASSRLSTRFNEAVQDLLFHKRHTILHMIDECTRWTAAIVVVNSKQGSEGNLRSHDVHDEEHLVQIAWLPGATDL